MTVVMLMVFVLFVFAVMCSALIAAVAAVLARAEGASYAATLAKGAGVFAAVLGLCVGLASAASAILALR
ncbi:hypothetical protein ABT202_01390 [Streptomyces sp900105245]|uniref:hypothetical protein n=1 Tax=Streptomyces sp. 900105245 TaxID=3154379 RepID=UPI003329BF68